VQATAPDGTLETGHSKEAPLEPKLERILVAVDSGPSSDGAVERGLRLATEDGAEIIFVHVVAIPGEHFVVGGDRLDPAPERGQTRSLLDAREKADAAGVKSRGELLVGYPPKQIAALADDLDVDLVVVGARRLNGIKRLVLSRTSRALVGETDRPVLVVTEVAPVPAHT
jgi:nucleotide-binding universal stress UspA family protein